MKNTLKTAIWIIVILAIIIAVWLIWFHNEKASVVEPGTVDVMQSLTATGSSKQGNDSKVLNSLSAPAPTSSTPTTSGQPENDILKTLQAR
ncbi:MAG TPA: hypothetical protein VFT82_02250 [Candidatus Paceibacterota bacterium]|nr:hypothetical protein [Candidatus Paceibacterota bacterium]